MGTDMPKFEYSKNNEKITITLSHRYVAEGSEKSNKLNLASLDLILVFEVENERTPEEPQNIGLPLLEEMEYKTLAE